MSTHLRDESYYNGLYDLHTIEKCLRFAPAEEKFREFSLYFIKGERYRNKSSVIREWMDRDRKRDELFQDAIDKGLVQLKRIDVTKMSEKGSSVCSWPSKPPKKRKQHEPQDEYLS